MSYFECFSVTVTTIFCLNPKLRLYFGYCCTLMKTRISRSSYYRFTFLCLTFGNLVQNNQIVKNCYEYDYLLPKRCFIRGISLLGRDSQNLKIDLRHTKHSTQLVGKNLVRQKNSLGTCIPFDIRF